MQKDYKTIRLKIPIKLWKQLAKQAIDKDITLSVLVSRVLESHQGKEGKIGKKVNEVKKVKEVKSQKGKIGKKVKRSTSTTKPKEH